MTKSWARIAARIYTCLIVPIASGLVAGALFVLSVSPAALKHIADAGGSLSTFNPMFGILVVALGWYVLAWRNGEEARKTERDRREHSRQGTRRQVRTLLRDAVATINPLVFLFQSTDVTAVLRTYNRFIDRFNERETAQALSDAEYNALDAFVADFGRAIALVKRRDAETEPPPLSVVEAAQKERRRFMDERALFFVQHFGDTLTLLLEAVTQLDEGGMRDDVMMLMRQADLTRAALETRLNFVGPSAGS
jgi:hypothetical protein